MLNLQCSISSFSLTEKKIKYSERSWILEFCWYLQNQNQTTTAQTVAMWKLQIWREFWCLKFFLYIQKKQFWSPHWYAYIVYIMYDAYIRSTHKA